MDKTPGLLSMNISQKKQSIRANEQGTIVMLVGATGAGKSSLINSIINIMDDTAEKSMRYIPTAPPKHKGGHTLLREPVEITKSFTIIDNRGWNNWTKESALNELAAQINGERGFHEIVEWERNTAMTLTEGGPACMRTFCIAVVINVQQWVESRTSLPQLVSRCHESTGRRPLIVVIHTDEIAEKDMRAIHYELSVVHGVSAERVFCIQQKHDNSSMEGSQELKLLDFLGLCICDSMSGRRFHDQRTKFKIHNKHADALKATETNQHLHSEVERAALNARLHKISLDEKLAKQIQEEECCQVHIVTEKAKHEEESRCRIALLEEKLKQEELDKIKKIADIEIRMKEVELEKTKRRPYNVN